MAGRLIGAWNPALDSDGNPISGSLLNTYVAGTTTPKQTFTDSGLTTPSANPVVADSVGRFPEIWADDGATYDLKWCDAGGAQIKLFEDVQALGSAASGAVTRDFGADGKFNIESRGGTTYVESGDADPDNTGGLLRLGGWAGTQGDTLTLDYATVTVTGVIQGVAQRGAIGGLTLSTAGSSGTFGVASGQATDSTGTTALKLSAAFTKTTAAWAAGTGNGALDTGTIANNTWYHAYLIANPTTGAVDVTVSTNATTPGLPSGYTRYRRIGSMATDGSAHWTAFAQNGDRFDWVTSKLDVNASTTTGQATFGVSTPLGVVNEAILRAQVLHTSGAATTLSVYRAGTSGGLNIPLLTSTVASNFASGETRVMTNTSSQVSATLTAAAGENYSIETAGWIDRRGRDS